MHRAANGDGGLGEGNGIGDGRSGRRSALTCCTYLFRSPFHILLWLLRTSCMPWVRVLSISSNSFCIHTDTITSTQSKTDTNTNALSTGPSTTRVLVWHALRLDVAWDEIEAVEDQGPIRRCRASSCTGAGTEILLFEPHRPVISNITNAEFRASWPSCSPTPWLLDRRQPPDIAKSDGG